MEQVKVLFVGGLFPKEIEKEIYEKSIGTIQVAANIHQWNIIEGLDYGLGRPVSIMNMLFIGSYPKRYKDVYIKEFMFSHTQGAEDINLGFFNLTVLKSIHRRIVLNAALKKWLYKNRNSKKVIFMYSAQNLFFDAAKTIKKIDSNAHICLIIPDLPLYMDMDKEDKIFFRLLTKYTVKKTLREIGIFDSYVLLTEYMRSYFKIDKPYVVIEGMVNKKDAGCDNSVSNYEGNDNIKYIVYTGTLTKKYGIMDLVKAFTYIKHKNYRLIICGEGEAKKDIESYSKKDKRIIFKGAVRREEALEFQRKATLLVNPRSADEEYTKYSFPSKILEYMLAGKPVLCNKLKGIPDDYDEYLLYFNTNSLENMADRMVEICEKSKSELEAIGEKNIKYVLAEKNNIKRTAEIIQMINDTINKI